MSTRKGQTPKDKHRLGASSAPIELELDVPGAATESAGGEPDGEGETAQAPSWVEPTAQQASSEQSVSSSPFGVFDDDDEEAPAGLRLELAGEEPSRLPSAGPRPRSAAVAARGAPRSASPRSAQSASSKGRRVRLMGRSRGPSPSKVGEAMRIVLAALIAIGLAAAVPYTTPLRLASLPGELGVLAHLPFVIGAAISGVVALWLFAHGARWIYLSLLLAAMSMLAVAVCWSITAGALAVPGLVGETTRMIVVIATPWSAMAAAVGLALYGFGRAKHLLRQRGVRWLGVGFTLSALAASAAVAWTGRQPVIGVGDVAQMQLVAAEPRMDRLVRRYVVTIGGARALEVDGTIVSPPAPRQGAAVAAALRPAEAPDRPAPR